MIKLLSSLETQQLSLFCHFFMESFALFLADCRSMEHFCSHSEATQGVSGAILLNHTIFRG